MAAQPDWLYTFVSLAGASLVAAAYIFGLVVTLRRWHLGMAARLGAIGFGLLLIDTVGMHLFSRFQSFLFPTGDTTDILQWLAVAQSVTALLSATGLVLIAFALRTALNDVARLQSGFVADDLEGRG